MEANDTDPFATASDEAAEQTADGMATPAGATAPPAEAATPSDYELAQADFVLAPEDVAPPTAETAAPPADVPTLHQEPAVSAAEDSLLDTVVQRVLAWHNRSRFTRTLNAGDVSCVGLVALPFVAGAKGPEPAFRERVAAPLWLATVRRFAARHAVEQRPGAEDWPLHDVPVQPGHAGDVSTRFLISAAIETGDRRLRLLLSPEVGGPIIGPKAWRRPSRMVTAIAAGGMAAVLLIGGALAWWLRPPAPATVVAASSVPGPAAAAPTTAPRGEPTASAPDADDEGDEDDADGAADAADAASAPAADETGAAPAPNDAPRPGQPAGAAEPATAHHDDDPSDLYALVSRSAPSRAMAEHELAGLRALVALQAHATASRVELMPQKGRWLVVWWPFVSRQQAEQARAHWQAADHAAARGWQVLAF